MRTLDIHARPLNVSGVVRRLNRGEIDLAPEYQRGRVWSRKRQALLIDSMLRGYDLPKFFVRSVEGGPQEVVDGQQRLTAIAAFFANEVPLPKESEPYAGKRHDQLPSEMQDLLDDYELHFSVISDADDEEVREMFLRLQMGVRLNAAEELNAVAGGMHKYVADLADLPLFTERIAFSINRGAHRHVAAQLARLAVEGTGDVRKADLLHLYKAHVIWEPDEGAKRLKRVIDWAVKVFIDKDPLLRNRGQAVSFLWGIYSLWDSLDFAGQEEAVRSAFVHLDQEHLNENPAFASYSVALSHSSDQKRSVEVRHHYVLAAIAEWASSIPRRDPKRVFSSEERAAMYYRDGGTCQESGCGKSVKFTEFHSDHVVAWTHGGATTLANSQVLCAAHNLAKGAR